MLVFNVLIL